MTYLDVFFIIYLITAGFTAFVAFSVIRIGRKKGVNLFSLLMITITIWLIAAVVSMRSPNEEIAAFFAGLRFCAVILTPLFWANFTLMYTDNEKILFHKVTVSILFITVISLFLFLTTNKHGLFYGDLKFIHKDGYYLDGDWERGPYFPFFVIHSYTLMVGGVFFLVRKAVQIGQNFRKQALFLIGGVLFPLLGNVIIVLSASERMFVHYDLFGMAIGTGLIWFSIRQLNLFDVTPIARQLLIDNLLDGMIVVDHNNRIVDINPVGLGILKSTRTEVVGNDVSTFFSEQIKKLINIYSAQTAKIEWHNEGEKDLVDIYHLYISPIYKDEKHLGFLLTLRNITEQKLLERRLKELAITDSLTGVFNHRHFYELIEKEFGRALRKERPLSLVMFDIDFFKKINDSYGHLAGDQILRELAGRCKAVLRQYDIFARYGGEEFVVILPETTQEEGKVLAERLRKIIEDQPFGISGDEINVTISLGVSSLRYDRLTTYEDLIANADEAMYVSKEAGRNIVSVYSE